MKDLELRQRYKSENSHRCELCWLLTRLGVVIHCEGDRGLEVHHGIPGAGSRWDVVEALLCVCRPAHEFCHKHPREGRIAFLFVKVGKAEFDEDVLKRCSGQFQSGWLENQIASGDLLEGFTLLAEQCLDLIQEFKKGD